MSFLKSDAYKKIHSEIVSSDILVVIIRSIQKLYISYLLFGSGQPQGVYDTFVAFIDQNAIPDKETVNISLLNVMSKVKMSTFIKSGDLYYKLMSVLEFKDPQMRQVIQSVISLPSKFISEPAVTYFIKYSSQIKNYPKEFKDLIISNQNSFQNDDLFIFIYVTLKILTNSNFNNKQDYLKAAMDLADSEIKDFSVTGPVMTKQNLSLLNPGNPRGISRGINGEELDDSREAIKQLLRYNTPGALRNRLKNFITFCLNLKIVQYPYYINPKTLELYLCKTVKYKFTFDDSVSNINDSNITFDDEVRKEYYSEKNKDLKKDNNIDKELARQIKNFINKVEEPTENATSVKNIVDKFWKFIRQSKIVDEAKKKIKEVIIKYFVNKTKEKLINDVFLNKTKQQDQSSLTDGKDFFDKAFQFDDINGLFHKNFEFTDTNKITYTDGTSKPNTYNIPKNFTKDTLKKINLDRNSLIYLIGLKTDQKK